MGSTRGPGRIIVVYNESPSLIKGEPQDGIPTPRWRLCRNVSEVEDGLGFR